MLGEGSKSYTSLEYIGLYFYVEDSNAFSTNDSLAEIFLIHNVHI